MATVISVLSDWQLDEEHEIFYGEHKGLVLRWLNEAQLRYFDKNEMLRGTWTPTITSSGNIALPSDFLREYPDKVLKTTTETTRLYKVNYEDAKASSFTDTTHYSIFAGTFYVWNAAACNPLVPYIKRPTALTYATIESADLEVPTQYHHNILLYLDAQYAKRAKDYVGYKTLLGEFDNQAMQDGLRENERRYTVPIMRGSFF